MKDEGNEDDEDLLKILGIERGNIDLDQIEIVRAVMKIKKEDRIDIKKSLNDMLILMIASINFDACLKT